MKKGLFVIWITAALFTLLCEIGILPTGYIAGTPGNRYMCDALSVLTAVAGAYFILRRGHVSLPVRLFFAGIAVFPSLFIYYAKDFASSAIHGLAIGLTATLAAYIVEKKRNRPRRSAH